MAQRSVASYFGGKADVVAAPPKAKGTKKGATSSKAKPSPQKAKKATSKMATDEIGKASSSKEEPHKVDSESEPEIEMDDAPQNPAANKRKATEPEGPAAAPSEKEQVPRPPPPPIREEGAAKTSKRARKVVAVDSDDDDVEVVQPLVAKAVTKAVSAAPEALERKEAPAMAAAEAAVAKAVVVTPPDSAEKEKSTSSSSTATAATDIKKQPSSKKGRTVVEAAVESAEVVGSSAAAEDENDASEGSDLDEEEELDGDSGDESEEGEEGAADGVKQSATARLMHGAKVQAAAGKAAKRPGKSNSLGALVSSMPKVQALIADAKWKKGEPVPYAAVAETLSKVEAESGRLAITEIVRRLLVQVMILTPDDLAPVLYLVSNKFAPAYEGVELGIGRERLIKAIALAAGSKPEAIRKEAAKRSLADIAATGRSTQARLCFAKKPAPLTARGVLDKFRQIASVGSEDQKFGYLQGLLNAAQKDEARYIVKGTEKNMGIGLAEKTVVSALAYAAASCELRLPGAGLTEEKAETAEKASEETDDAELSKIAITVRDSKSTQQRLDAAGKLVRQALNECPNYDELVAAMRAAPLYLLQQRCKLKVGVPVAPMLAKPESSIQKALVRLAGKPFTCEYKYDGERAQIHMSRNSKGEIQLRIFSRNSEDNTGKYPDLVPVLEKAVAASDVQDCVLDAEVVAVGENGNFKPFQAVLNRKRKDVTLENITVQVALQAFDLMYLNGCSLLREPLKERRDLLHKNFAAEPGKFDFAVSLDVLESGDTEPIEVFLSEAVAKNCEGLMVKTLTGVYEPAERASSWIKLKKDYLGPMGGSMADSLDLVPIGAYFGKGKRQGKYGAFLLACYDPEFEQYQSICKIGTGFSDELLDKLYSRFKDKTLALKPKIFLVKDSLKPDVWFDPEHVWEVKGADMTISPNHCAAMGKVEPNAGISVRFPRLLGEREDKDPQQATTADEIVHFYSSQDVIKNNAAAPMDDDGDL